MIFSSIRYKKNVFSQNVSRETFLMNQIGNVIKKMKIMMIGTKDCLNIDRDVVL